jgi:hypothetical protein
MTAQRFNLHESVNSHRQYDGAPDLMASGGPELIQVFDPEIGKTALFLKEYGGGELLSDVCILDYYTGAMTVVDRETAHKWGVEGFDPALF